MTEELIRAINNLTTAILALNDPTATKHLNLKTKTIHEPESFKDAPAPEFITFDEFKKELNALVRSEGKERVLAAVRQLTSDGSENPGNIAPEDYSNCLGVCKGD